MQGTRSEHDERLKAAPLSRGFVRALILLAASAAALVAQLDHTDASLFAGQYHPVGNDSFYHARRILDAAQDPRAFYEFDTKIHAPEGSLVTWPWAYDYTMAQILRVVSIAVPDIDRIKVLAHIPAVTSVITVALILSIGTMLGLSNIYLLVAGLATALLPTTQMLHGVGNIDQHFAEYMAVLGTLAAAMAWMQAPSHLGRAGLAGLILGLAPGVHSALFVLQVPILVTTLIRWIRKQSLPFASTGAFAAVLVLATILLLLPSEPARLGLFEYYRLSWYQLYVAGGTAAVMLYVAAVRPRLSTVAGLALMGAVLAVPLVASVAHAQSFFARDIAMNRTLQETQSVLEMMRGPGGLRTTIGYFSGFLLLLPLTVAYSVASAFRSTSAERQLFFVTCLLGIPLLLSQMRLHYFGSFALYLPLLMALSDAGNRSRYGAAAAAGAVAFSVASFWIPLQDRLFVRNLPANDIYYSFTSLAMPTLAEACRTAPGIVLANSNDGHYIRYHTDCSVVSNNFLVTPQHERKALQTSRMLGMTPEELLSFDVPVRYVLARAGGLMIKSPDGSYDLATREMAESVTSPLYRRLLWEDPAALGHRWQLLEEWRTPGEDGFVFMRLWKITD